MSTRDYTPVTERQMDLIVKFDAKERELHYRYIELWEKFIDGDQTVKDDLLDTVNLYRVSILAISALDKSITVDRPVWRIVK